MAADSKELLKELSGILLLEDSDYERLSSAANTLFELLSEIAGFTSESSQSSLSDEIILESGKAISPNDAARCLLDFPRTSKFLKGLRLAILEAQKRFPNEKIEILYAGCGPFATLAIPLCTQFNENEIAFTLIDYHDISIKSAKRIFANLGFSGFIKEFIRADAASYEPTQRYHIILAEIMQKALEKEPQAAATLHLSKYLYEGGIFIPEKITITACLGNLEKEFDPSEKRERVYLKEILSLTKETQDLPPTQIDIPDGNYEGFNLMLLTKIFVFGAQILDDYDSGITYPSILFDSGKLEGGQKIEFKYEMGERPGFRCIFK